MVSRLGLAAAVLAQQCAGYFVQFDGDLAADWASAEANCVAYGGNLASIHSKFENEAVLDACTSDRCWIGYDDLGVEDNWKWTDGTSKAGFTEMWSEGEPNNANDGEDCAYMHGLSYTSNPALIGQWGDHPCSELQAYVCSLPDVEMDDPDIMGDDNSDWTYWHVGEWETCSSSCGDGVQTRVVTCLSDTGESIGDVNCEEEARPDSIDTCYMQDCGVSRFTFYEEAATWEEAEASCVAHGGHLASIHSVEDQSHVFNECLDDRCWIGYNDRAVEGKWVWSDKSSNDFNPVWAPGEPDDSGGNEDCGYMHGLWYSSGQRIAQWGDHPCTEKMSYVCESKYKFFPSPLPWLAAESVCEGAGGHLAKMSNQQEVDNVYLMCQAERCWAGANDREVEGTWKWTDGSSVGWTSWAAGEPNDSDDGEDCGYIHGNLYSGDEGKKKHWGDHPCVHAYPYVCELHDDHMDMDVMSCSYSTEGVTYDLSPLSDHLFDVEGTRHHDGHSDYRFHFNICGNTETVPALCRSTTGSDYEPKHVMTGAAPAYQILDAVDDNKDRCWRLGDNVHTIGNMEWGLVDEANPAAGVTLTYKNGNVCVDDIYDQRYCVAEYNGGYYCHRQLKLIFTCADDVFNIPDEEEVLETVGCEYQLTLPSAYGCPTQCPIKNRRVCNGHGVCGYDSDRHTARCFCNHGYGGDSCIEGEASTGTLPGRNSGGGDVEEKPRYYWSVGGWSDCSASCNKGHRQRHVECHNQDGILVTSSICSDTLASKPDQTVACYEKACPPDANHPAPPSGSGTPSSPKTPSLEYQYVADAWSQCAPMDPDVSSCGVGVQTRGVSCLNGDKKHAYGRCSRWATRPEVRKTCYIDCGGGASATNGHAVAGGGGGGGGGGGYSIWTVLLLVTILGGLVYAVVLQRKDYWLAGRKGSLYDRWVSNPDFSGSEGLGF